MMDFLSTLSIGCLVNFLMTTSLTKADFVWARSTKMQLKYLVKFLLRQSDVMLRIVKLITSFTVMRCVPYHVPKAHLTSKGNHTHEVHIKFRLRNTSLKKDGYFRNRLFSGAPSGTRFSRQLRARSSAALTVHRTVIHYRSPQNLSRDFDPGPTAYRECGILRHSSCTTDE